MYGDDYGASVNAEIYEAYESIRNEVMSDLYDEHLDDLDRYGD